MRVLHPAQSKKPSSKLIAAARGRVRKAMRDRAHEMMQLCKTICEASDHFGRLGEEVLAQDKERHAFLEDAGSAQLRKDIPFLSLFKDDTDRVVHEFTEARQTIDAFLRVDRAERTIRKAQPKKAVAGKK